MDTEERYELARKTVRAKFDFYIHLGVYIVLMIFLAILNLMHSPGYYWFIWPLVFWGLAVALHGVTAMLRTRREQIIDRMTEKEMSKNRFGR